MRTQRSGHEPSPGSGRIVVEAAHFPPAQNGRLLLRSPRTDPRWTLMVRRPGPGGACMAVINAFARDVVDLAEPLTLDAAYVRSCRAALTDSRIGMVGLEIEAHLVDLDSVADAVSWQRAKSITEIVCGGHVREQRHAGARRPGRTFRASAAGHRSCRRRAAARLGRRAARSRRAQTRRRLRGR